MASSKARRTRELLAELMVTRADSLAYSSRVRVLFAAKFDTSDREEKFCCV